MNNKIVLIFRTIIRDKNNGNLEFIIASYACDDILEVEIDV